MPVAPTYPGVYIEEVPSGVHTITGVSTATAAFLGRTSSGPLNKAVRILSLSDYERTFGAPHPKNDLASDVRLFFQNGGSDCYVVRLAKKGTTATASVDLKNESGTAVVKLAAKEPGGLGNELAAQVKYNAGNPEGAFDLAVIRVSGGAIKEVESHNNLSMDKTSARYAPLYLTQNSKLVDCTLLLADATYDAAGAGFAISRRPVPANTKTGLQTALNDAWKAPTRFFKISVDGGPFVEVDLSGIAVAAGTSTGQIGIDETREDAKGKIKTAINNALPPGTKVDVDMVAGPAGPAGATLLLKIISDTAAKKSIAIQQSPTEDLAGALMLGTEQGGIDVPRYSQFRPAPNGTILSLSSLDSLAGLAQNDFNSISVGGSPVNLGTSLVTSGGADKWFKDGITGSVTGNSDGVREKLKLIAKEINDAGINFTAELWGYRLALLPKSGINNASAPVTTAAVDHAAFFPQNVRSYSLGSTGTGNFQTNGVNGLDGDAPGVSDYKGSEIDHTGFFALDLVDLFNLMIVPKDADMTEPDYRSLWAPASAYCTAHRAFLLINSPESWSSSYAKVVDPGTGINSLRTGLAKDHAAVFYPRLTILENGLVRPIGAAGAIAGLMARTDSSRGVWKAPAGIEADIRDIVGLDLALTDMENGVLNKQGVNCLRIFPNGIVNWGARTTDGADDFSSEWKYIPVRRTALFLEESLFRGTKWVVFEPNDEPLWAQIRLNIGAFMQSLFRQGAFQGKTPREAYLVKCDKETTTQDDINRGIVNILVGFAPLKPAEFVIIKIQQLAGQIQT